MLHQLSGQSKVEAQACQDHVGSQHYIDEVDEIRHVTALSSPS